MWSLSHLFFFGGDGERALMVKKKTCYGLGVLLQTAHLMSVNGKLLMFFLIKNNKYKSYKHSYIVGTYKKLHLILLETVFCSVYVFV